MGQKIVATLGLVTLGCCLRAGAQAAQNTDTPLQEVVVTAEMVPESVEKAPISVTVFDQRTLQQMGAQSFVDYAPSVPALSFQSLGTGEQRILLRGVSDGVDIGLRGATQSTTGVYIDDMVVSNNETAPDLNLFDVERVEVLKGPQGTLYGDGSVGGLLRIITHQANASRTEGTLEATGAAINHGAGEYAVNGMFNAPLVQDKLGLRLVGQYLDNQGFIDDIRYNRKGVNNMREAGGRASLRWLPRSGMSVDLKLLYQKSSLANDNQYNGVLGGDLVRNTIYEEPKTTRFTMSNLTFNWDLNWADLVSSAHFDAPIELELSTSPASVYKEPMARYTSGAQRYWGMYFYPSESWTPAAAAQVVAGRGGRDDLGIRALGSRESSSRMSSAFRRPGSSPCRAIISGLNPMRTSGAMPRAS